MNTKTLVVDNFRGSMTNYLNGDINSGRTNVIEVFGYDPFSKAGRLTWAEQPTQIDVAGAVITDLIMAGKPRVESGILYIYAIGHTGRLYKIQVNDPTTYNPTYNNPVLLATLTAETPTFTRGGFIDFFGSTERIYIGHDKGVTRIDFAGTNETFVGAVGSWTQTVPRPLKQFLGKLYIGNGTNLAEIDSTATVTTYAKLSPAFPTGSQVRDLDVTPDGNYLQAVVAQLALSDMTSITPDTPILAASDSYIYKWNGIDTGYTSFVTYSAVTLSANTLFGDKEYVFGYDMLGGGVYNPIDKFLTSTYLSAYSESPNPNAVGGAGNLVFWSTPLPFEGYLEAITCVFGTISQFEVEPGYWCPMDIVASGTETDIVRVPCQIVVSNFAQGSSSNGYTNNIFGSPLSFFSTLETSNAPTTKYKFYSWAMFPAGLGTPTLGYYETQTQLFSKKVQIKEVRVYGDPWIANNAFTIYLIGSGQQVLNTKTFTAGTNLTVGDDFAWYSPAMEPTYALGLGIENAGTTNHTISKIEIDYTDGGK